MEHMLRCECPESAIIHRENVATEKVLHTGGTTLNRSRLARSEVYLLRAGQAVVYQACHGRGLPSQCVCSAEWCLGAGEQDILVSFVRVWYFQLWTAVVYQAVSAP